MKIDDLTLTKKKHNSRLVAVFMVVLIIFSALSIYITVRSKSNSSKYLINIYYYDPIAHELIPVKEEVSGATDKLLILDVFEHLQASNDTSLFSVVPQNVKLTSSDISNGTCFINLQANSVDLKTISLHREYAAVYGIVNTLTEIDGISSVQFSINGEKRSVFAHYVAIEKPLFRFDGSLPKTTKANLFFPTPDFRTLVVEQREIIDEPDPTKKAQDILKELFSGSSYGLPNLFSNDILKEFSIQSGGVAVVNLNDSIFKNSLGAHLENLFVLSIVNTLTEIPDIQSVQIKVNGYYLDTLFGSVDIGAPIQRFFENGTKYLIPYYAYEFNDNEFYAPEPIVYPTYDLNKLFEIMKTSNEGLFITKIPKNAKITQENIKGGMLNMTVDLGYVPTSKDLDTIKRTIALSFTEIPGIYSINLHIGEESFLLGR
jgi:germination protein M